MLALLYLLAAIWIGDVLCRRFFSFGSLLHRGAAAVLVGLLVSTWVSYLGVAVYPRSPVPLLGGNLLFLVFFFAVWKFWKREPATYLPRPPGDAWWDFGLLALCTSFTSWLMYRSLSYTSEGVLRMAVRQWSDFGATLAIVQSFAWGHNFPPEYPHFAGPPLSYHYLFHFQAGNLEWLGWKLHHAFNVLSILTFVAFAILILTLGERLARSRGVGRVAALLFFFHGSLSYVPFLASKGSFSEIVDAINHKDGFLESIYPYRGELWGIWSLNIFANQRHLASAVGIFLLVLVFLVDAYEWRLAWPKAKPKPRPAPPEEPPVLSVSTPEIAPLPETDVPPPDEPTTGTVALAPESIPYTPAPDTAPAPDAQSESAPESAPEPSLPTPVPAEPPAPKPEPEIEWEPAAAPGPAPVPGGSRPRLFLSFCFAGVLLGLLPLWNGPVFLSAGVVLAGLFLLLPLRGYMIGMGVLAGAVGIPQLLLWRTGGTVGAQSYPAYYFGYVVEPPTLEQVFKYLAFTWGFKWILILVALFFVRRLGRSGLLAILATIVLVYGVHHYEPRVEALGNQKILAAYIFTALCTGLVLLYAVVRKGFLGPVTGALSLASFGLVALAFFVQFSIELAANHKFLAIWVVLINVAVACALCAMARLGLLGLLSAVLLTLSMTISGFIDVFPFKNDGSIDVAMEHDPLMDWLLAETDPRDVFLTDNLVTHKILLAGRKLYRGYEYYAWSAGYNTEERVARSRELYSQTDAPTLVRMLNENNIRYVCYDDAFSRGPLGVNEWMVGAYFPLVFKEAAGDHFRVYRVPTATEWEQREGNPLRPVVVPTPVPLTPAPPPERLSKPLGLAVAPSGELLVAEVDKACVQRVTMAGQFIGTLGVPDYKEPNGVAVDYENEWIYVADTWNQRIRKLTLDGTLIQELPPPSTGFYAPRDVAVAPNGDVFVANTGRSEIVRYGVDGSVLASWGHAGAKEGEFSGPLSLTVGAEEEVYVADYLNARVQVFDFDGGFRRSFPVGPWQGAPTWYRPSVAFRDGRLFAADSQGHAILILSPTGQVEGRITSSEIHEPTGLAFGGEGTLYVTNLSRGTIAAVVFTTGGRTWHVRTFAPSVQGSGSAGRARS